MDYKERVFQKWAASGYQQPETKEELDIIMELQSKGYKAYTITETDPTTRETETKTGVNQVKKLNKMLRDLGNY